MSVVYNQIANRSLERIGALSDGLFAIAMTLIVLEIRVPELHDHTDAGLWTALLDLAPRFVTYLLSFLTLGIFWNGQQTQLSYIDKGDRDLAWLELLFLAVIALFPFTTSLLAENIDLRLALGLYWLNIFVSGAVLWLIWAYAERSGIVRDGTPSEVGRLIRRRIGIAQVLYGLGFLISLGPWGTLPAIAWIVLVQLNYAIAPRIWVLHRL
ncbi:MAG TPA: TMEM175 family protein [Candidatus Limnocylindrales bacterium]|nr:TMEM175 family protein [Candidatus Limnocylindrales bacterium]